MNEFNFNVTLTEIFKKSFNVKAEDYDDAVAILEKELEDEPLDQRKNTLEESYNTIDPIPNIHTVEGLFDPDGDNSGDEVILVDELSDEQKHFLNLDE